MLVEPKFDKTKDMRPMIFKHIEIFPGSWVKVQYRPPKFHHFFSFFLIILKIIFVFNLPEIFLFFQDIAKLLRQVQLLMRHTINIFNISLKKINSLCLWLVSIKNSNFVITRNDIIAGGHVQKCYQKLQQLVMEKRKIDRHNLGLKSNKSNKDPHLY